MEIPLTDSPPKVDTQASTVYARYLVSVVAGIVGALVLWLVLVFLQLGAPTISSEWTEEIYLFKESRLEALQEPALLIVGGSNAVFSLRAEAMDRELSVPVLNFGTHAGLGLDYLLFRAQKVVRPGDTVLLPLEYSMYLDSSRPSSVLVDYVLAHDPGYLRTLGLVDRLRFLMSVSPARLIEGLSVQWGLPISLGVPIRYDSENLNAFGDETSNLSSTRNDALILDTPVSGLDPERPTLPDTFAWGRLKSFLDWAEANGVRVAATFPATLFFPDYESEATAASVARIVDFYRENGVSILGDPWEFMYERALMYDSRYHLTQVGMTINTEKMISSICSDEALAGSLCP